MIDTVVMLAMHELGLLRTTGTSYQFTYANENIFDDEPMLRSFVDREVRAKVAEHAGCAPELVIVIHLRNAYLADVWARRRDEATPLFTYNYDVPDHLAAIIGIRIPTKETP